MTIEERAEEYSKDKWAMGYSKELEILRSKEGYFRGATEQEPITKQEMIEKVCKWIDERCAGGVHPSSAWNLSNEFRKAMEE